MSADDPTPDDVPNRRKRRFWQLRWSIRTMLGIVAIIAVVLSWFGYAYRRIEWKMQIVRSLLDQGGRPMQNEGEVFSVPQPDGWAVLTGNESSLDVIQVHAPVNNGRIDDRTVQALDRFPELEILTLSGQQIGDEALKPLRGLDSLKVLALDATNITDRSIPVIADMKSLEELNLSLADISDESIAVLQQLKNLKGIQLMDTRISPAGANLLRAQFPAAEILYTHSPSEAQRIALKELVRAGAEYGFDTEFGRGVQIEADQWNGDEKALAHLAAVREFEVLIVDGVRPANGWSALVSRPSELSVLFLFNCRLTTADWKWIAQAEQLRVLSVSDDTIDDRALAIMGGLKNLDKLHLLTTKYSVTNWQPLAGLHELRELTLTGAPLTDKDIAFLDSTPKLQQLSVGQSQLTNAIIPRLARLESLASLELDATNVTDDAIEGLKKIKSLKHLSVLGSRISERGVNELRAAMPDCDVR